MFVKLYVITFVLIFDVILYNEIFENNDWFEVFIFIGICILEYFIWICVGFVIENEYIENKYEIGIKILFLNIFI